MKLNKEYLKCASKEEVDITKNMFIILNELELSLEEKDYIFPKNYFYERPNGTKVYLCEMDDRYRRNALKYFKKKEKEYGDRAFFSRGYDDYECDYSRDVWLG